MAHFTRRTIKSRLVVVWKSSGHIQILTASILPSVHFSFHSKSHHSLIRYELPFLCSNTLDKREKERHRERERNKQRNRQRDRKAGRETETDRKADRETGRDRQRQTERQTDRERQTERQAKRQRGRQRDRERGRQTDQQRGRQADKQTDQQTQRHTETGRKKPTSTKDHKEKQTSLTLVGPAAFLMCCSRSLRARVTAVAALPRSCRRLSSLQADCAAETMPSTDLATSLAASISCSWQAG